MDYKPLDLREFHGGITENFIDGPAQQYEKADNLLVTVNRKLYTRPGSRLYDELDDSSAKVPNAARIGTLIDHYNTLLVQASTKLYYLEAGSWETLQGPVDTNDVFTLGDTTSRVSWSDWNKHTFVANDDFSPVMKIFRDDLGDLQVRSAGLPLLATTPIVTGSSVAPITATNKFLDFTDSAATVYAVSIPETTYTSDGLATALAAAMNATASADVFTVVYNSVTSKFTISSDNAIFGILWATGTNSANSIGTTIGFDVSADDTEQANTSAVAISSSTNYIYAFLYSYEYEIGTVTFLDLGGTTQVQLSNVYPPNLATVNITGIPVVVNGSSTNYDVTNIKVRIYRTQDAGTTFTYVKEVSNGTIATTDSASDASILSNASLYTDGGELSNNPPPACRCLHITDTVGLYGHIKTSSGEILSNRIRQSKPSDPDSCPDTLYVDVDASVVAISSVGQTPVVLCDQGIYRLDGLFENDATGQLVAQEIESTVGCISMNSVVQVQRGVVFAGNTGFYFTDGWEVRKLSTNFNETYKNLTLTETQRERIYATFDDRDKRVWWSVQEDGQTEVNANYVLDTRYGLGVAQSDLENVQSAYTTCSGGVAYRPTALLFFDNKMMRGDDRGYLLEHVTGLTSDPNIDASLVASAWATQTIIWDFKSIATSFGTTLRRKFVPRVVFSAENETDVTVQIISINDIGKQTKPVKTIRFRKNWLWGDQTKKWNVGQEIWNFKGIIEEERRFHSDGLRCSYKQVEITNAFDILYTSDDLTTATVDDALKTFTLDDISTYNWPNELRGQMLYFEYDNYTTGFEIIARTDDVITYVDVNNKIPAGSYKWTIQGYARDEVLNLISISLRYAYLSPPADFASASVGSNPS